MFIRIFKKAGLIVSVALLSACTSHTASNLGEFKTGLKSYVERGNYDRDFEHAMGEAETYVLARSRQVSKPAIVLDIDETSLSNWPQLHASDFAFFLPGPCEKLPEGPCGLKEWQKQAIARAYPATLHLNQAAVDNKIAVFFITGRDEKLRRATERNLKNAGYHNWTALIMRPAGTKTPSAIDYKVPQRRKIEASGYHIIASIGDQPSDLIGGFADKTFLIPNPFYRIP